MGKFCSNAVDENGKIWLKPLACGMPDGIYRDGKVWRSIMDAEGWQLAVYLGNADGAAAVAALLLL